MSKFLPAVAVVGAALLSFTSLARAADIVEEPVYVEPVPVSTAGWYLRGDVGYVASSETSGRYGYLKGAGKDHASYDFIQEYHYDKFETDSAVMVGGGLGYRFNDFARVDVTADWFSSDLKGSSNCVDIDSRYCSYDDKSDVDIWLLMANAYVDLFHYGAVSFYGGAGAGGAYVDYGTLRNKFKCPDAGYLGAGNLCGETYEHEGRSSWRFAASLMAGATFDLTTRLKLDAGYKYTRIAEGEAFGWDSTDRARGAGGAQGHDNGFDIHTVRAGLRYEFGGGGFGKAPEPIYAAAPAEPAYLPEPVFK
ncbi:outer membrane beta-barrel protein [Aurantimonas sp. Leaf443]|uniref:outer membrane protein n=1 Tax=Aurantimonas sp. Leaf443 TaxID=1736378 RepID=UPI0006FD00BA|nr:outer membrane beta-barrel protein [Aurantimonas sp. Leaf443]KQT88153.1 hypothetical protein ASG48_01525 [Aurantimonas sp. Leaf443]